VRWEAWLRWRLVGGIAQIDKRAKRHGCDVSGASIARAGTAGVRHDVKGTLDMYSVRTCRYFPVPSPTVV
jgi:hypothetical protein